MRVEEHVQFAHGFFIWGRSSVFPVGSGGGDVPDVLRDLRLCAAALFSETTQFSLKVIHMRQDHT